MNAAPKEKLFSRDYLFLVLFSTTLMLYVQIYLPTMAMYAKLVTGSNFITGFAPGIFMCASLVAIRCSIPIIRKFGKARTMALGSVIMGLSAITYFFSGNVWIFILARIIHGFGNGLCMPSSNAAIADVVPKARLMEGIGYYSLVQTFTGAVGPAVALRLVENNPKGFNVIFLLAFILSAICFLLSLAVRYERKGMYAAQIESEAGNSVAGTNRPAGPEAKTAPTELKLFLGIETILFLPMLMQFTSGIIMQSLGSYLSLSTQERGIPSISYFFSIQALAVFLSKLLVSRVADRHGVGIILVPSFIALSVSMYFISTAMDAKTLYIVAIPYGFASGAVHPAINGLFFKIGAPGRNAETSAAFNATNNLSVICLAIAVGLISSISGGYKYIFNGAFILPLISLAAYWLHTIQYRRRTGQLINR